MLVLSRKQKQQIKIGDDIVVTVIGIRGGAVRLGIEAPGSYRVLRMELEDRSKTEDQEGPGQDSQTAGLAGKVTRPVFEKFPLLDRSAKV